MTTPTTSGREPARKPGHRAARPSKAGDDAAIELAAQKQQPQRQLGHGHGHGWHGGHGHSEDRPLDPATAAARRRATILLAATVIPLAIATIVGVFALWPDGDGPQDRRLDTTYGAADSRIVGGTIRDVETFSCGGPEEAGDDPSVQRELTCVRAEVRLTEGPDAGSRVPVDLPPETHRAGVSEDAPVRLLHTSNVGPDGADYYSFIDFEREFPMLVLAIGYAAIVVAVARMRGLRALLGLGFAYVMLGMFMLPALLEGKPAGLVGLAGASAIMFVALYLAHGLSARTTTALLGTMFGLAITVLLATWAVDAAKLSGMAHEGNYYLLQATDDLDLSQLVLCGIIIAGLGVLNDVTITQASAVWELYELSPTMTARRLFTGAMRIGRDHIASTVYTIAFAYAGAALPILLLIRLYERPVFTSLTSGELAEEVVRTLVGSIGLVLAIPITTGIGVVVVKAVGRPGQLADASPAESPEPGTEPVSR